MKVKAAAARLAAAFEGRAWDWTRGGLPELAVALELAQTAETPYRVDYRTAGDVRCAAYTSGESVSCLNLTLAVVEDPRELEPSAWEREFQRLAAFWEQVVEAVAGPLGKPDYAGAYGAEDYPWGEDAVRLAFWQRTQRTSVELRHDDAELPMLVSLVVQPREE